MKKLKPAMVAVITNGALTNPVVKGMLDHARETKMACFLIVDKNVEYPDGWHSGLNIHSWEWFETLDELKEHAKKISQDIIQFQEEKV